jgi:hypothetical protein
MSELCHQCWRRAAVWLAFDEPEQHGTLEAPVLFGDEPAAIEVCERCLQATEADGPWHAVLALEGCRVLLEAA